MEEKIVIFIDEETLTEQEREAEVTADEAAMGIPDEEVPIQNAEAGNLEKTKETIREIRMEVEGIRDDTRLLNAFMDEHGIRHDTSTPETRPVSISKTLGAAMESGKRYAEKLLALGRENIAMEGAPESGGAWENLEKEDLAREKAASKEAGLSPRR